MKPPLEFYSQVKYKAQNKIKDESLYFFKENPKEKEIKVISHYVEDNKDMTIVRKIQKEKLEKFLGFDFTTSTGWAHVKTSGSLNHKDKVLKCFEFIS